MRSCIKDALINQNYFKNREGIPQTIVDSVMKELTFTPATEQIYSATGCKRVAEKVDFVMVDFEDSKLLNYSEKDEM